MIMHRLAPLALLLAASACAAPTAALPDTSLDGTYAGQRVTDASCGGRSEPIVFHIAGGTIAVRSHHKRRELNGTVSASGEIDLENVTDQRRISGQIAGDTLTATETVLTTGAKHTETPLGFMGSSCLWRITAARVATPAPRD